ncbi:hypothetical protein AAY473_002611 [Plecturocebus cupreus]
MHFSAWDVSALHMEPSAGLILIMRCRFFIPMPQVALHSSHSPHSVIRQLLGAGEAVGSVHTEPSSGNCFTYLSRDLMPMPQEMLQGDQVIHSDMVQPGPMQGWKSWVSGQGTLRSSCAFSMRCRILLPLSQVEELQADHGDQLELSLDLTPRLEYSGVIMAQCCLKLLDSRSHSVTQTGVHGSLQPQPPRLKVSLCQSGCSAVARSQIIAGSALGSGNPPTSAP